MIQRGKSRTVFLIGRWAIKVPSFRNGSRYWAMGLLGNLLERDHWRMSQHPNLAPVLACGPCGLWLVMRRYRHILKRQLTADERAQLPFIGIDDNGANIAIDDGRCILIDYGNVDWYLDITTDADEQETYVPEMTSTDIVWSQLSDRHKDAMIGMYVFRQQITWVMDERRGMLQPHVMNHHEVAAESYVNVMGPVQTIEQIVFAPAISHREPRHFTTDLTSARDIETEIEWLAQRTRYMQHLIHLLGIDSESGTDALDWSEEAWWRMRRATPEVIGLAALLALNVKVKP